MTLPGAPYRTRPDPARLPGVLDACFLAWAITLVYLLTYVITKVDALGLLVHPTAFGLLLTAALAPVSEREDPILKSLFLPIHTTLAFFGYAALFVAFGMGLLYLVQERGLKSRTLNDMLERRPEEVIRLAVKGMLPKNRLARKQLTKLKVYAGPEHPHAAQQPKPLELETH